MPQGIRYNPLVHDQITSPKTSNQINLVQNIQTPTFSEDKYVALGKEVKGGHYVEYLSQLLVDDQYAGIFLSRREKGMLVSVHYNDNGTPLNKVFQLIEYPGTKSLDDWQPIGGVKIEVFNRVVVAHLTDRDDLDVDERDVCIVEDARQQVEIDNGDAVYSATFIWNGISWLIVRTPGEIDASEVKLNTIYRHSKNTDTHLDLGGDNPVAAATIVDHIGNQDVHFEMNDAADKEVTNATYSAKQIHFISEEYATNAVKDKISASEVDAKIKKVNSYNSKLHPFDVSEEVSTDNLKDNSLVAVIDKTAKTFTLKYYKDNVLFDYVPIDSNNSETLTTANGTPIYFANGEPIEFK